MEQERPKEALLQCGDCAKHKTQSSNKLTSDFKMDVTTSVCCCNSCSRLKLWTSTSHMPCPKGSHWWQKGRWEASKSLGINCHQKLVLQKELSWCVYLVISIMVLAAGSVSGDDGLRYTIPEEGQVGMFVGDVFEDADFYTKYEGDSAILSQLRFLFLRGEQSNFAINNRTGVIRTTQVIDREGIDSTCINQPVCDFRLDVAIQPSEYFEIIRVTVRVADVNDHAPEFSEQRVTHRMLESSLPGTNIVTFNVQDLDSPSYSIQRFELLPASNTKFRVTSSTQPDGSREVRLKLLELLDRESESEYNLRIVAYDGGTPLKTGSVDVQVIVLDTNDNNPTFSTASYEVDVPEDTHVPHMILQVQATDPDSGSNGEISYGFRTSTLRNHGDMFDIDEDTGEIYLIKAVDFETVPVYHLGVTAMDKGPLAVASDATVIVRIVDVNDHAPTISVSTLSVDGRAIVPENAAVGTFVSHVSVADLDSGDNAIVSCYLDSSDFSLEYLYDTEYQMVSTRVFDRELLDNYAVKVTCVDQGTDPKSSVKNIQVSVSDVNDHAPVFRQEIYYGELLENSFQGAVAIRVEAMDADIGINGKVIYSLDQDIESIFTVDPLSGEVKARRGLDREHKDTYQFMVYATDQGEPYYSNSSSVVVRILDVNDRAPVFSQPNYSFGVFENEPAGTDVGALSAEDGDNYPFNIFNFTFLDDSDEFAIDSKNGRITTKKVLDRERQDVYHLVAAAVEEGKRVSSTVSLSIYIADVNDNIPVFVFPNSINNTVFLSKDVPHGYIATRLEARDMDIANSAKVTYDIVSASDDNVFDIDRDRGTILVYRELTTYEDVTIQLNVSATDNGVPQHTSYANITIIVNGSMPIQPRPDQRAREESFSANNLVIVIALASTSGVITIILVMAIICIRRQDRNRPTSNGKYNCRMEAHKFFNINKRKKLVGGSTSSGSTSGSNGSDNGDCPKNKKEVSFSLEVEENPVEITTHSKSQKSWPSIIDHQTLQTPRAHSSLLNTGVTPPSPSHISHVGNGHIHGNGISQYSQDSIKAGNNTLGNGHLQLGPTQREIEIQQLLEMLKRDQDSSSLTSGDGSNTDSGRGASEEGDTSLSMRIPAVGTDGHGHPGSHHLPPVPEDSYSSNQVVPSFCDSSMSFMSHHNSTIGSYLPPEHIRAASRNSNNQRYGGPLKTFQNSTVSSTGMSVDKSDSTMLNMSAVSHAGSTYSKCSPQKPRLKSILKAPGNTSMDQATPQAQQGMTNYLKSRMVSQLERRGTTSSDGELSDIEESEMTEDEIKYSCVDVSDILNSKAPRCEAEEDDDDDVTTTSGSYTVDPKELCDQIDELFFKNMT